MSTAAPIEAAWHTAARPANAFATSGAASPTATTALTGGTVLARRGEVEAFVAPSGDQDDRGEATDARLHGGRRRRFGVVVPGNAVLLGHQLDPVRGQHGLPGRFPAPLLCGPRSEGHGRGGGRIGQVVRERPRQFGGSKLETVPGPARRPEGRRQSGRSQPGSRPVLDAFACSCDGVLLLLDGQMENPNVTTSTPVGMPCAARHTSGSSRLTTAMLPVPCWDHILALALA